MKGVTKAPDINSNLAVLVSRRVLYTDYLIDGDPSATYLDEHEQAPPL